MVTFSDINQTLYSHVDSTFSYIVLPTGNLFCINTSSIIASTTYGVFPLVLYNSMEYTCRCYTL